jgi:hypothetical protein
MSVRTPGPYLLPAVVGRTIRSRPAGEIAPPSAVDSDGTPVPVSLSIDGGHVIVSAPHRGRGYAYPILVDPLVQTLDQMPTAVRNAEDYLGPDGDIGSMSPEDRGQ